MDWQANGPDSHRPPPVRAGSKRELSSSPPAPQNGLFATLGSSSQHARIEASLAESGKRLRASSAPPPAVVSALSAHQALYDAHQVAPCDWSDLGKRITEVQRHISNHVERLKAWSSLALAEALAARTAESEGDVATKLQHVAACQQCIAAAQTERSATRQGMREQLGAPWNEEESGFWDTLAALDEAEDRVAELCLGLVMTGWNNT